MLWLDVVKITDGATRCFAHAYLMCLPTIDGIKIVQLSVMDKSQGMIFESRAASNKVRDDVNRFDNSFRRKRKAHWGVIRNPCVEQELWFAKDATTHCELNQKPGWCRHVASVDARQETLSGRHVSGHRRAQ